MAHKDWCGKSCKKCEDRCHLFDVLACYPDCENVREDGASDDEEKCKECQIYKDMLREEVPYDGEEE